MKDQAEQESAQLGHETGGSPAAGAAAPGRLRRAVLILLLLPAAGLCVFGAWPWIVSWREGRAPIATFSLKDASGTGRLVALFMPSETLEIDFGRAPKAGPDLMVQGMPLRAWWWSGAGWSCKDLGDGLVVVEGEVPKYHVVETKHGGALVVPGFYIDAFGLRDGRLVKLEGEALEAAREAAGYEEDPALNAGDTVIIGGDDAGDDEGEKPSEDDASGSGEPSAGKDSKASDGESPGPR